MCDDELCISVNPPKHNDETYTYSTVDDTDLLFSKFAYASIELLMYSVIYSV